jgi:hypothetical protein
MHVHDWIDERTCGKCPDEEKYAVAFLHIKATTSAVNTWVIEPIMKQHKLFCTYKGSKYRVTGCSSMGDIWLVKNYNKDNGYDLRVDIEECTDWSEKLDKEKVE